MLNGLEYLLWFHDEVCLYILPFIFVSCSFILFSIASLLQDSTSFFFFLQDICKDQNVVHDITEEHVQYAANISFSSFSLLLKNTHVIHCNDT